jgi:hypothetical protein
MPLASKAASVAWKRVPWKTVWTISVWLATKGRDRVQRNLTANEQREFWELTKKSRGKPGNLTLKERARMKKMAGKAIRG